MEFENILTPTSANFNFFSPYSCGIKQGIENLFDVKGQEENNLKENDPLNHLLLNNSPLLNLDFPSPHNLIVKQTKSFSNNIPTLELPLNIQKKLEKPKEKNLKKEKKNIKKENINEKKIEENKIEENKIEENIIEEKKIDENIEIKKEFNYFNCWNIVYSNTNDFIITALTKTRCDKPSEKVDEILYSSLKYEIKQYLSGKLNYPFLLAKIYVVDSVTGEQILKNNKSVLKGQVECTITNSSENKSEISGTVKVQFTDVSYHHKKGDFCWEIAYYTPNELNLPLLKIRSSSFKVFARKPSQLSSVATKKRKKDDSENFKNFTDMLEELVKFTKKLKSDDKKIAINLVSEKLKDFEKNLNE